MYVFEIPMVISFEQIVRNAVAGPDGSFIFKFLRNLCIVYMVPVLIYIPTNKGIEGSLYSRSLLKYVIFYLFENSILLVRANLLCTVYTLLSASFMQHNGFQPFLHTSLAHFFLLLDSISLYEYIANCLSIQIVMGIRFVSRFWVL